MPKKLNGLPAPLTTSTATMTIMKIGATMTMTVAVVSCEKSCVTMNIESLGKSCTGQRVPGTLSRTFGS